MLTKNNHSFDRMTSNLCTIILEETNKQSTYSMHFAAREMLPVRINMTHVNVSSIIDIRKWGKMHRLNHRT